MNLLIEIIKSIPKAIKYVFNNKNWCNATLFLIFALVTPCVFVNDAIGLVCFIWGMIGFIYWANKFRLDLK